MLLPHIKFKLRKYIEVLRAKKHTEIFYRLVAPWYHGSLALFAAFWYGFPSRRLKVIGVTGTKGKSSVVFLAAHFFENAGILSASIGSIGARIGDKEQSIKVTNTMPGRFVLQRFLRDAVKAGAEVAFVEVTSEGIMQNRHLGTKFDAAVFTNLEPEHIERHGSFEAYYAEKQKLFASARTIHVINSDSRYAELFMKRPARRTITFGINSGDVRANDVKCGPQGAEFSAVGIKFQSNLLGEHNIMNALAAIAIAQAYGVPLPSVKEALGKILEIPGRLEEVRTSQPFRVFIDYAHTPESLRAAYIAVKQTGAKRLIAVLGSAGGGRDRWKRKIMGGIAVEMADVIILTNEDPYNEKPEAIIADIKSGITENTARKEIFEYLDRTEAINKAIQTAQAGDAVIITGKGSETVIHGAHGANMPWSDKRAVQAALGGAKHVI